MIMKNLAISIKNVSLCSGLSFIAINTLTVGSASAIALVNPSFESDSVTTLQGLSAYSAGPPASGNVFEGASSGNPGYVVVTQDNNYSGPSANVTGWRTTEADTGIELWQSGFNPTTVGAPNGAAVFTAPGNGNQFAEVNANVAASLYQDLTIGAAGGNLYFNFWHRPRENGNTVEINAITLTITDSVNDILGDANDIVLFTQLYSSTLDTSVANYNTTGNRGWTNYSGDSLTTAAFSAASSGVSRRIRFAYSATSTASTTNNSNLSFGNFLDNANFSDTPIPFDFSPNLGIGILGGLYLGNKFISSLKDKKGTDS